MKRLLFTIALMIYGIVNLHSQTILVLDFDTEIEDFQNNTKIMADMLRSDLVNTQKLDVIDRKSMDLQIEIMQNQMSDYMSNQNVQELGKMMNADYLVIGQVMSLSNVPQSQNSEKNFFLRFQIDYFMEKTK